MAYRIRLNGIIVVHSEDVYAKVVKLAEEDELFSYISQLLATGSEREDLIAKLDQIIPLMIGDGVERSSFLAATSPIAKTPDKSVCSSNDRSIEKVAPPISGSAAKILARMKKNRKLQV